MADDQEKRRGRVLGWGTFWGRHLDRSPFSPWLAVTVVVGSVLISLSELLGLGLSSLWAMLVQPGTSLPHLLLEWTCALIALLMAVFAWGRLRTGGFPEALVLAPVMPVVAVLDAYVALSSADVWGPWPQAIWIASRYWMAFGFLVASWIVSRIERPSSRGAALSVALPVGLGLGITALLAVVTLVGPASLNEAWGGVVRIWHLVPLVCFVVAGLFLLPAVHRAHVSIMSHALIVSIVPQILCQLEAALVLRHDMPFDLAVAEQQKLLAYLTLLVGIVFDYISSHRATALALAQFRSAQSELQERGLEIRRIDQELAERRIEKEWVESRMRMLEKAVETMSLGVTITRPDGRILYTNPADACMHGYRVDELIGRHSRIFQAPEVDPPAAPPPAKGFQLWVRETLNHRQDGQIFPVRLISDAVCDDLGRMTALVTICEDISERKRAEDALEHRDRVLLAVSLAAERFLVEEHWEGSVGEVLDHLGQATGVEHVYLGQRASGAGGGLFDALWSAGESLPDDSLLARLGPEPAVLDAFQGQCHDQGALYGGREEMPPGIAAIMERAGVVSVALVSVVISEECWGLLSLENRRELRPWSASEIEALKTAARILAGAIQRHEARRALEASESNYRDLVETATDLVQSVTSEGRLLFVNRAWREVLGYEEEEVTNLDLWDVVAPESRSVCEAALRQALEEGSVERIEAVFETRTGTEISLEGSLARRLGGSGAPEVLAIFRDVTERKMIDRLKQDFISTVSHELRTPLTSLLGSLGLLRSPKLATDKERVEELLDVAQRNGERLLRLINDLLDLQKMAAGELSFEIAPAPVKPILSEALEGIRGFADSMQVQLKLTEMAANLTVLTDRDRLVQILYNLLSNAIKFSSAGAHVTLTARSEEGEVLISVIDEGEGIPQEFRQHLFEKFAQADASSTRRAGGSGLGLSIVRNLVDGLKGRIDVESEVGIGTRVTVVFPRALQNASA